MTLNSLKLALLINTKITQFPQLSNLQNEDYF